MITGRLNEFLDKLRRRKKNYQAAFAPGSPGYEALIDFAQVCKAFAFDAIPHDRDQILIAYGQRQAFFYIMEHLHFEPEEELELYKATGRLRIKGE